MATLLDVEVTADFSSTVVSDGTISDDTGRIAIEIATPSTAARYGVKTFTSVATDDFRLRWYWEKGTLDSAGAAVQNFIQVLAGGTVKFEMRMDDGGVGDGSNFRVRLDLKSDAEGQNASAYTGLGATWPEFAEIWIQKATNGTGANDARVDLYFDGSGTPTLSVTGVDLFDDFGFDELRIGHVSLVDAELNGTMYLDHIKATDSATVIGEANNPPVGTVPASGTCINTYTTTAVPGMSVAAGSSPITSVTVSCTAGGLMTFDATGTSVSLAGNGTNSVVMTLGASAAEYSTVLDTLLMQGTTPDTQLTITLAPTDGTLPDSDQFTVLCDPAAITITGTNANVIAAVASLQIRLLPDQTHDTISVTAVDDTSGTPLEVDSSFIVGLDSYLNPPVGDGDLPLLASTRGITDVIM